MSKISRSRVMLPSANAFGQLLLRMGEVEDARSRIRQNLALARDVGRREAIAKALGGLAMVDALTEQFERAAEVFATVHSRRASAPLDQAEEERHIAPLRSKLGDAGFDSIWARGTAMDMCEAIQHALGGYIDAET